MAKYRKKPVVIEAVRYLFLDQQVVPHFSDQPDWLQQAQLGEEGEEGKLWLKSAELMIGTMEGPLRVSQGDWIIRGVSNEIYPCKPDIFEKTYEEA
jgi:hypothetical protein